MLGHRPNCLAMKYKTVVCLLQWHLKRRDELFVKVYGIGVMTRGRPNSTFLTQVMQGFDGLISSCHRLKNIAFGQSLMDPGIMITQLSFSPDGGRLKATKENHRNVVTVSVPVPDRLRFDRDVVFGKAYHSFFVRVLYPAHPVHDNLASLLLRYTRLSTYSAER